MFMSLLSLQNRSEKQDGFCAQTAAIRTQK